MKERAHGIRCSFLFGGVIPFQKAVSFKKIEEVAI
jgi:hypothetical protein